MRAKRLVPLTDAERVMKVQEAILKAKAGELQWKQAAEILGITDRHLRRLRAKFDKDPNSLFPKKRGPSHLRLDERIAQRILQLYREEYEGYNVRHFHEEITEIHGIKIGYTCTKELLQKHELVPKYKKRGQQRRRRKRKPLTGMLLHIDGSDHHWFDHHEDKRQCLIAIVDDADGRCLEAKFFKHEGTSEVFDVLKTVVDKYGTFVSLYTDRASHFAYTPKAGGRYDAKAKTQVELVLDDLGIELIRAYSPQARGRSERAFGTMQGRLPQELKHMGIKTYKDANEYLQRVFIPKFNQKFAVKAQQEGTAFIKTSGIDTEKIFCRRHQRRVNKDNTVQFDNRSLQMPRNEAGHSYVLKKVEVRKHPDGSLHVFLGRRLIASFPKLKRKDKVVTNIQADNSNR